MYDICIIYKGVIIMSFGEKLFTLRKSKGLSQEALAEKLNTSRQAISKWENDQGYPETEKLLMIGNIFEVSMDYLLKDSIEVNKDQEEGYYVSKEFAEGYLINQRKMAKYIGFGLFLITLSIVPYFIFKQNPELYLIPTIILATVGIGTCISTSFIEENQYKILKQEPLLFDEKYLKELTVRYESVKRRYGVIMLFGTCLFVAGLLTFGIERNYLSSYSLEDYHAIVVCVIGVGLYIFIYTTSIIESHKLLAENEEYVKKLIFKLRRKARKKIDEF